MNKNRLIIIGNGFDLAHGLKTKYTDFVIWYINKVFSKFRKENFYEDEVFQIGRVGNQFPVVKKIESVNDFYGYFKNYQITITHKSDFIKRILQKIDNSKWVDIECDYYSALVGCYKNFELGDQASISLAKEQLDSLNLSFEFFKNQLVEYLQSININESYRNLEISNHFKQIIEKQQKQPKIDQPKSICILNFNYTNTLGLYSTDLSLNEDFVEIINIHGSIDNQNNPIIFGYGDEMDTFYPKIENLKENTFLNHIKSFGYFKTSNYRDFIRFIDSDKFEVLIMGHSCGLSDRILLNSIFEHDNCTDIQIYYHKRSDVSNDHFEKTQEISRHFKPENKGKMRRRIVPFDKCLPLT
jgi:hypothetical protein